MPQQINLSTPVLLAQKRYFSARTMLQALGIFMVLGGALMAFGIWSLNNATRDMQATLQVRGPELTRLREAIAQSNVASGGDAAALGKELLSLRTQLLERQMALVALRRGQMAPGQGHSARLQLVAQSIPPQVWVTQVQADETRLEVRGFTLEPVALNDWVGKLAASPLLRGQQWATVNVERVDPMAPAGLQGGVPVPRSAAPAPAVWAFRLGSMAPSLLAVQAGKP